MRNIPTEQVSYDELPEGRASYLKGFGLKTLLRAITRFMEALYFSLNDYSCLVLFASEN
jgi:hypothetical protein